MSSFSVPAPGKPTVTVDSQISTNITLSWTASNGAAESYEVIWERYGAFLTNVIVSNEIIGGDSTGYTIKEIKDYSIYSITVTATNVAGSAVSDPIILVIGTAGERQPVGVLY